MSQQPSSTNTDLWSLPSGNMVLFCLSVWALPLELALHRNFGRRYIGWHLVLAAVWPIFFSKLVRPDADPSWANGAFWIVMLLGAGHKSRAIELEKQGPDRHSGYSGEPWLGQLLRVSEVPWKVFWEPLLCIASGLALMWVNYPLGYFIVGGGAALRLKNWLLEYHEREAATDLFDAYCEQQMVAERFRGRK